MENPNQAQILDFIKFVVSINPFNWTDDYYKDIESYNIDIYMLYGYIYIKI